MYLPRPGKPDYVDIYLSTPRSAPYRAISLLDVISKLVERTAAPPDCRPPGAKDMEGTTRRPAQSPCSGPSCGGRVTQTRGTIGQTNELQPS